MIRRLLLTSAVVGVVFAAGCRHRCCLNDPGRQPAPYRPQAPNSPFLLPPAGVPTSPAPAPALVPAVGPDGTRNYPPPVLSPPAKPAPEVLLPDPIPGGASSRSFSPADPGLGLLGSPAGPRAEPPIAAAKPVDATALPGFVKLAEGIATGRKPALEGFESLRKSGYRTVVYLHPAGADVSAAKEVAEARGLKVIPLEVTPEKLGENATQFETLVRDKANRPLYVFDDNGLRSGCLWYLHFRTTDAMNDDAARIRARPLGFPGQGEEANAFALAVQRILEAR